MFNTEEKLTTESTQPQSTPIVSAPPAPSPKQQLLTSEYSPDTPVVKDSDGATVGVPELDAQGNPVKRTQPGPTGAPPTISVDQTDWTAAADRVTKSLLMSFTPEDEATFTAMTGLDFASKALTLWESSRSTQYLSNHFESPSSLTITPTGAPVYQFNKMRSDDVTATLDHVYTTMGAQYKARGKELPVSFETFNRWGAALSYFESGWRPKATGPDNGKGRGSGKSYFQALDSTADMYKGYFNTTDRYEMSKYGGAAYFLDNLDKAKAYAKKVGSTDEQAVIRAAMVLHLSGPSGPWKEVFSPGWESRTTGVKDKLGTTPLAYINQIERIATVFAAQEASGKALAYVPSQSRTYTAAEMKGVQIAVAPGTVQLNLTADNAAIQQNKARAAEIKEELKTLTPDDPKFQAMYEEYVQRQKVMNEGVQAQHRLQKALDRDQEGIPAPSVPKEIAQSVRPFETMTIPEMVQAQSKLSPQFYNYGRQLEQVFGETRTDEVSKALYNILAVRTILKEGSDSSQASQLIAVLPSAKELLNASIEDRLVKLGITPEQGNLELNVKKFKDAMDEMTARSPLQAEDFAREMFDSLPVVARKALSASMLTASDNQLNNLYKELPLVRTIADQYNINKISDAPYDFTSTMAQETYTSLVKSLSTGQPGAYRDWLIKQRTAFNFVKTPEFQNEVARALLAYSDGDRGAVYKFYLDKYKEALRKRGASDYYPDIDASVDQGFMEANKQGRGYFFNAKSTDEELESMLKELRNMYETPEGRYVPFYMPLIWFKDPKKIKEFDDALWDFKKADRDLQLTQPGTGTQADAARLREFYARRRALIQNQILETHYAQTEFSRDRTQDAMNAYALETKELYGPNALQTQDTLRQIGENLGMGSMKSDEAQEAHAKLTRFNSVGLYQAREKAQLQGQRGRFSSVIDLQTYPNLNGREATEDDIKSVAKEVRRQFYAGAIPDELVRNKVQDYSDGFVNPATGEPYTDRELFDLARKAQQEGRDQFKLNASTLFNAPKIKIDENLKGRDKSYIAFQLNQRLGLTLGLANQEIDPEMYTYVDAQGNIVPDSQVKDFKGQLFLQAPKGTSDVLLQNVASVKALERANRKLYYNPTRLVSLGMTPEIDEAGDDYFSITYGDAAKAYAQGGVGTRALISTLNAMNAGATERGLAVTGLFTDTTAMRDAIISPNGRVEGITPELILKESGYSPDSMEGQKLLKSWEHFSAVSSTMNSLIMDLPVMLGAAKLAQLGLQGLPWAARGLGLSLDTTAFAGRVATNPLVNRLLTNAAISTALPLLTPHSLAKDPNTGLYREVRFDGQAFVPVTPLDKLAEVGHFAALNLGPAIAQWGGPMAFKEFTANYLLGAVPYALQTGDAQGAAFHGLAMGFGGLGVEKALSLSRHYNERPITYVTEFNGKRLYMEMGPREQTFDAFHPVKEPKKGVQPIYVSPAKYNELAQSGKGAFRTLFESLGGKEGERYTEAEELAKAYIEARKTSKESIYTPDVLHAEKDLTPTAFMAEGKRRIDLSEPGDVYEDVNGNLYHFDANERGKTLNIFNADGTQLMETDVNGNLTPAKYEAASAPDFVQRNMAFTKFVTPERLTEILDSPPRVVTTPEETIATAEASAPTPEARSFWGKVSDLIGKIAVGGRGAGLLKPRQPEAKPQTPQPDAPQAETPEPVMTSTPTPPRVLKFPSTQAEAKARLQEIKRQAEEAYVASAPTELKGESKYTSQNNNMRTNFTIPKEVTERAFTRLRNGEKEILDDADYDSVQSETVRDVGQGVEVPEVQLRGLNEKVKNKVKSTIEESYRKSEANKKSAVALATEIDSAHREIERFEAIQSPTEQDYLRYAGNVANTMKSITNKMIELDPLAESVSVPNLLLPSIRKFNEFIASLTDSPRPQVEEALFAGLDALGFTNDAVEVPTSAEIGTLNATSLPGVIKGILKSMAGVVSYHKGFQRSTRATQAANELRAATSQLWRFIQEKNTAREQALMHELAVDLTFTEKGIESIKDENERELVREQRYLELEGKWAKKIGPALKRFTIDYMLGEIHDSPDIAESVRKFSFLNADYPLANLNAFLPAYSEFRRQFAIELKSQIPDGEGITMSEARKFAEAAWDKAWDERMETERQEARLKVDELRQTINEMRAERRAEAEREAEEQLAQARAEREAKKAAAAKPSKAKTKPSASEATPPESTPLTESIGRPYKEWTSEDREHVYNTLPQSLKDAGDLLFDGVGWTIRDAKGNPRALTLEETQQLKTAYAFLIHQVGKETARQIIATRGKAGDFHIPMTEFAKLFGEESADPANQVHQFNRNLELKPEHRTEYNRTDSLLKVFFDAVLSQNVSKSNVREVMRGVKDEPYKLFAFYKTESGGNEVTEIGSREGEVIETGAGNRANRYAMKLHPELVKELADSPLSEFIEGSKTDAETRSLLNQFHPNEDYRDALLPTERPPVKVEEVKPAETRTEPIKTEEVKTETEPVRAEPDASPVKEEPTPGESIIPADRDAPVIGANENPTPGKLKAEHFLNAISAHRPPSESDRLLAEWRESPKTRIVVTDEKGRSRTIQQSEAPYFHVNEKGEFVYFPEKSKSASGRGLPIVIKDARLEDVSPNPVVTETPRPAPKTPPKDVHADMVETYKLHAGPNGDSVLYPVLRDGVMYNNKGTSVDNQKLNELKARIADKSVTTKAKMYEAVNQIFFDSSDQVKADASAFIRLKENSVPVIKKWARNGSIEYSKYDLTRATRVKPKQGFSIELQPHIDELKRDPEVAEALGLKDTPTPSQLRASEPPTFNMELSSDDVGNMGNVPVNPREREINKTLATRTDEVNDALSKQGEEIKIEGEIPIYVTDDHFGGGDLLNVPGRFFYEMAKGAKESGPHIVISRPIMNNFLRMGKYNLHEVVWHETTHGDLYKALQGELPHQAFFGVLPPDLHQEIVAPLVGKKKNAKGEDAPPSVLLDHAVHEALAYGLTNIEHAQKFFGFQTKEETVEYVGKVLKFVSEALQQSEAALPALERMLATGEHFNTGVDLTPIRTVVRRNTGVTNETPAESSSEGSSGSEPPGGSEESVNRVDNTGSGEGNGRSPGDVRDIFETHRFLEGLRGEGRILLSTRDWDFSTVHALNGSARLRGETIFLDGEHTSPGYAIDISARQLEKFQGMEAYNGQIIANDKGGYTVFFTPTRGAISFLRNMSAYGDPITTTWAHHPQHMFIMGDAKAILSKNRVEFPLNGQASAQIPVNGSEPQVFDISALSPAQVQRARSMPTEFNKYFKMFQDAYSTPETASKITPELIDAFHNSLDKLRTAQTAMDVFNAKIRIRNVLEYGQSANTLGTLVSASKATMLGTVGGFANDIISNTLNTVYFNTLDALAEAAIGFSNKDVYMAMPKYDEIVNGVRALREYIKSGELSDDMLVGFDSNFNASKRDVYRVVKWGAQELALDKDGEWTVTTRGLNTPKQWYSEYANYIFKGKEITDKTVHTFVEGFARLREARREAYSILQQKYRGNLDIEGQHKSEWEKMSDTLFNNPTDPVRLRARYVADRSVYKDKSWIATTAESLGKSLSDLQNPDHKIGVRAGAALLDLAIPFRGVPLRIGEEIFSHVPIVGMVTGLSKIAGIAQHYGNDPILVQKERFQIAIRQILGISLTAAGYALGKGDDKDELFASLPRNSQERSAQQGLGRRPTSLLIGNHSVDFSRFLPHFNIAPYAYSVGRYVNDKMSQIQTLKEKGKEPNASLVGDTINQSFSTVREHLFDYIPGTAVPEQVSRNPLQWLANRIANPTNLVPGRGLAEEMQNTIAMIKGQSSARDVTSDTFYGMWGNQLKSAFSPSSLPNKRTVFGQDVAMPYPLLPIKITKDRTSENATLRILDEAGVAFGMGGRDVFETREGDKKKFIQEQDAIMKVLNVLPEYENALKSLTRPDREKVIREIAAESKKPTLTTEEHQFNAGVKIYEAQILAQLERNPAYIKLGNSKETSMTDPQQAVKSNVLKVLRASIIREDDPKQFRLQASQNAFAAARQMISTFGDQLIKFETEAQRMKYENRPK